jgi:hypothetical protein
MRTVGNTTVLGRRPCVLLARALPWAGRMAAPSGPKTVRLSLKSLAVLLFALTCAAFVSCSRQETVSPSGNKSRDRSTDKAASDNPFIPSPMAENANWAILTKAELADDVNADLIPPFQGVWQPSQSDVRLAIHAARRYLEKEQAKEILAKWDKYVCQAVGHTRNGKRLIHLNFFPRDEFLGTGEDPMTWRHHYVVVDDGGNDFWQIDYDCDANVCLDFEANGYA